jgi:hypothetical protein
MTTTPYWKLRRLAPRTMKVFDRHRSIPAFGAYAASIVPTANAYVAACDAVRGHEATWKREMAEGRGAMKSLLDEVQLWKPHVARESPTFDLSQIADRPDVPEDLFEGRARGRCGAPGRERRRRGDARLGPGRRHLARGEGGRGRARE